MSEFVRELGGLTVFVLCAQFLISFRPKESYEKYFQLLLNLLILLLFLMPVRKLIFGTEGVRDWTSFWREYEETFGAEESTWSWEEFEMGVEGDEDVSFPTIELESVEIETVTLEE